MAELKLIAFDADDLAVISAHLQDAVLKVGDIAYLPREKRFAAIGNRFDWADALQGRQAADRRTTCAAARRCASSACWAPSCRASISTTRSAVLSLLAISFEPAEPPEGNVTLHFADGARDPAARRVHRGRAEGPGAGVAGEVDAASIPDDAAASPKRDI